MPSSVAFGRTALPGAMAGSGLRLVLAPGLEHARVLSRHDSGLSFEVVDDCRERFTGLFPLPVEVEFAGPASDG